MAIKYSVVDHHSMWGWAPANATQEEADIIFTWNDFEMKSQVARWKERGKKVIDFTALLVGKKVFRIAEQEEYRSQTDPRSRNILPFSEISVELLSKDMEILVDIKDELSKSLEIEDVLEWVSTCI